MNNNKKNNNNLFTCKALLIINYLKYKKLAECLNGDPLSYNTKKNHLILVKYK